MTEPQYRDPGFDFHEKWCHLQSGMGGRCTCDSGYLSYEILDPDQLSVVGVVRARERVHALEVASKKGLVPEGSAVYYYVVPVPAVPAAEIAQAAARLQRVKTYTEADMARAWDEGADAQRYTSDRLTDDGHSNPYRKASS